MSTDILVADGVTVLRRGTVCRHVSLSVGAECVGLLERDGSAAATALFHCIQGLEKPTEGSITILGGDALRDRRRLCALVRSLSGAAPALESLRTLPPEIRVLLLTDFEYPVDSRVEVRRLLQAAVEGGAAVLIAARRPEAVADLATRIGIFHRGSLVLDDRLATLENRFRRIRYRNEITETRRDYGNELDAFDAVRVRVRGWGVEAIVSNYSESAFEQFRQTDGVLDAEAAMLTLTEIFEALTPEDPRPAFQT